MTNEYENTCGEQDALVGYLYDELSPEERSRFDAHLAGCTECRQSLEGMREVRTELAAWDVPALPAGFAITRVNAPRVRPWWAPGALAAAAVVLLAVAAAIANLEITYSERGVTVRTGWSRASTATPGGATATQTSAPGGVTAPAAAPASTITDRDLAALEKRLRQEFRTLAVSTPAPARSAGAAADTTRLLEQVQELIEQSELRQRRELALRVAQVVRDFDTQRQTDLVRIQQGIGQIEGNTAADRQLLNYLVRTSQRR